MGRAGKKVEADEPPGAPGWMVTFCDSMTLMLTFFVLLFSFSSFDEGLFQQLSTIFGNALSTVNPLVTGDKSAFLPTNQIIPTEYLLEGSEKPTLEGGWEGHSLGDTEPVDFHRQKVFLISSKNIFWGKGTAISSEGCDTLANMAEFLKKVAAGRVVISENGPNDDKDGEHLGLLRAWTVMEYLTTKQGLDKGQFSISASSTVAQENLESSEVGYPGTKIERVLEIVLLERSIYN